MKIQRRFLNDPLVNGYNRHRPNEYVRSKGGKLK